MTEFKYGSNSSNYHKKLSSGTATTTKVSVVEKAAAAAPHSRLRKSLSECESYEMDGSVSFNLSPSKRRQCGAREEAIHRHHHCPRQTTTDGNGDISFIDVAKVQYNYDTSKSQYLLQQQQKLKEYNKNDPNYLTTNGDNYSSESSSTETKGILKKSTVASSTTTSESNASNGNNNSKSNLLKRNKGLSTLSLCSCDADTEVSGKNKQLFVPFFKGLGTSRSAIYLEIF